MRKRRMRCVRYGTEARPRQRYAAAMNRLLKFCFAASAAALCMQASAQGMYKCRDAAGKITYASKECDLLGLMPGGEITGRIMVAPAPPPAPRKPAASPRPASEKPVTAAAPPPAPAKKADRDPESEAVVGENGRRCFKTANGTRCNDATD